jgi:hypothetical protein
MVFKPAVKDYLFLAFLLSARVHIKSEFQLVLKHAREKV